MPRLGSASNCCLISNSPCTSGSPIVFTSDEPVKQPGQWRGAVASQLKEGDEISENVRCEQMTDGAGAHNNQPTKPRPHNGTGTRTTFNSASSVPRKFEK